MDFQISGIPSEPDNLGFAPLRGMRSAMEELERKIDAGFEKQGRDIRLLGCQILAEAYTANKTVAAFAELEEGLDRIEHGV